MKKMKNLFATLLITATLLTGTSVFAATASINSNINSSLFNGVNATTMVSNMFRANSYSTRSHRYYLVRGTKVSIELEGDGDTDLDLYVYDSKGNLIAAEDGYTDYESMVLNIYKSSYFTIKVVNRGDVYNDYNLTVEYL